MRNGPLPLLPGYIYSGNISTTTYIRELPGAIQDVMPRKLYLTPDEYEQVLKKTLINTVCVKTTLSTMEFLNDNVPKKTPEFIRDEVVECFEHTDKYLKDITDGNYNSKRVRGILDSLKVGDNNVTY